MLVKTCFKRLRNNTAVMLKQKKLTGLQTMQANPPIFNPQCHNTVMLSMSKSLTCSAMLQIRIRMFLGLLDPDLLVRGTDSDPGSSITQQKK
jgi:hypothetical protein